MEYGEGGGAVSRTVARGAVYVRSCNAVENAPLIARIGGVHIDGSKRSPAPLSGLCLGAADAPRVLKRLRNAERQPIAAPLGGV